MTIIHTYLSPAQCKRLSQQDNSYLKRKLETKCLLNSILNKPINRQLLDELRCILDNKPIVRRKTEQHDMNSKVKVYNANGMLVRLEHSNGKTIECKEAANEMPRM